MKRFRFRLETVRSLRAIAERAARERFVLAQGRLAAALATARAAEQRRLAVAEALAGSRTGCFLPSAQVGGLAALGQAERDAREAERLHQEAVVDSARVREEWLAARRRLQAVERLEERARRAHCEFMEKTEQAQLDEIATIAAARLGRLTS
jgi:flagellar export protein FliJ